MVFAWFIIFVLMTFLLCTTNVQAAETNESINSFEDLYTTDEFLLYGSGLSVSENGESITISDSDKRVLEEYGNTFSGINYATAYAALVTSDEGINLIAKWEGVRLTAYQDVSGVWTIGYGHTGSDVTAGMTITQAQAIALLQTDVASFEGYVNNFCKKNNVTFTQSQFDAMVSFSYNVGVKWMSDSTIRTYILNGITNYTDEEIISAISLWCNSGGKFVQGLYNRRQEEGKLFVRDLDRGAVVDSVSLNLQGKIGVCFHVTLPSSIANDPGAVVEISRDGAFVSLQYRVNEGLVSEGKYMYSITIPIRNLEDEILFCIKNANGEKLAIKNANRPDNDFVYSVREYIASAGDSQDAELVKLVKALDVYSKSVRSYFGDEASSIATEVNLDSASLDGYQLVESGSIEGIHRKGSSLILESDTSIRHYFSLDEGRNIEEYKFFVNKREIKPKKKGDLYYIEISNISAKLLDETFVVAVEDSRSTTDATKHYEVSYSAFSYIYSAQSSQTTDNDLKGLCYYMYMYAKAADEYFK